MNDEDQAQNEAVAEAEKGGATYAQPEPGTVVENTAEPLAPTVVPEKPNRSLIQEGKAFFSGFPKSLFHPVHGRVVVDTPNDEASLLGPRHDYFDTPEEADMHRTATEAEMAHANNIRAKLAAHDDAGHQIVRNSVQADESIRAGNAEPL